MDLLVRHEGTGRLEAWLMNGVARREVVPLVPGLPEDPELRLLATADLTGDAWPDLLWRHGRTGALLVWRMAGVVRQEVVPVEPASIDPDRELVAAANFDAQPGTDLWWRDLKSGQFEVWLTDGPVRTGVATPTPAGLTDPHWRPVGAGDTDGDGRPDLLWQHRGSGRLVGWRLDGLARLSSSYLQPDAVWR